MTKEEKAQLDLKIGKMLKYYRQDPDPEVIMIYVNSLNEYDLKSILRAMAKVVKTLKFAPTVADIIAHLEPSEEDLKVKARAEAGRVLDGVRRDNKGYMEGDEITAYLMSGTFSHRQVEDLTDNDCKWWVKDFVEQYLAFTKSDMAKEHIALKKSPREPMKIGGRTVGELLQSQAKGLLRK